MSSGLKMLLHIELKSLEAGAFQDFCLSFLPFLDKRYKGLERHGATAEGKTRKGTPDLIKTDNSGSQIGVECSVQEDYWKQPQEIQSWKPCLDIIKCVEHLKGLKEIVLCSNQEIPTNNPNSPIEIINFAKSITNASIWSEPQF